jgi:hypothetical protein
VFKMMKAEAVPSETQNKKKASSEKKILANKANGKKGHGPHDTTHTRNNALKHGLRSAGVSMFDNSSECQKLIQELMQEMKPTGSYETVLVEAMAAELIRIKRGNQMEADDIDASIEYFPSPPLYPGITRPRLAPADAERLTRLYARYRTGSVNTFLRISRHLERRQRIALGEAVPGSAVLDANLTVDSPNQNVQALAGVMDQTQADANGKGSIIK